MARRQNLMAMFMRGECGATAIEYGLIAALLAVAIVGSLTLFGGNLTNAYTDGIANRIEQATP